MIIAEKNLLTEDIIEASNYNVLYPIANVLDPWINIVYIAELTATIIYIRSNIEASLLCIAGHNITETGSIKIEYYSDATFLTKLGEEYLTIDNVIIHELAYTTTYRRLVISNDIVVSLGYICLSKHFEAISIANETDLTIELEDEITVTSLGNNSVQERITLNNISFSFWLIESVYTSYLQLFEDNRNIYPTFIWQFPTGTTYKNKRCLIFNDSKISANRKIYGKDYIYYNFKTDFKEAK